MSTLRPTSAKILQHSQGLGVPTSETVQHRAEELALIDGRLEFTTLDWEQARRELHGGHESIDADGAFQAGLMVSERDMTSASVGTHVENVALDDQENIVEELIAEGLDEALHDQMLAARDRRDYVED